MSAASVGRDVLMETSLNLGKSGYPLDEPRDGACPMTKDRLVRAPAAGHGSQPVAAESQTQWAAL